MRLELREHYGYDDGAVVHHVTEVVSHIKEGEKFHRNHYYPVACGMSNWAQHLNYVDAPTTCIACLATHQPGRIKCRRIACRNVLPVEEMCIHSLSGEPYCSLCAFRINEHNANLVVPQS